MKVVCLATKLTDEQKTVMNIPLEESPAFPFKIGKVYTVLGLTAQTGSYAGLMLQIKSEKMQRLDFAPLCLFDIVDSRLSSFWEARKLEDNSLALWPKEFYQEYFHDDLSDYEPKVVEIFKEVAERLESEFE